MITINDLQVGDVFVTRNEGGEDENSSPGYYNHAAMYVGHNRVVEAQVAPFDKVIVSDLDEFIERYYKIKVLRYNNLNKAILAASYISSSVGRKYWKAASIFRRLRPSDNGENCVSVVRRAWKDALKYDPRWKKPDHVIGDGIFETVMEKG